MICTCMYIHMCVVDVCMYIVCSGCKYMSALWHVYAYVYAYMQRYVYGRCVCMYVFVSACHILTPGHTHMWRTLYLISLRPSLWLNLKLIILGQTGQSGKCTGICCLWPHCCSQSLCSQSELFMWVLGTGLQVLRVAKAPAHEAISLKISPHAIFKVALSYRMNIHT